MKEGARHRLLIEAWTMESETGETYKDFIVNRPPYGGACKVTPLSGECTIVQLRVNASSP